MVVFCSGSISCYCVHADYQTMHPPGGATALIANIGSDKIKDLGFQYVISPVGTGVMILLIVALIVNNIPKHRDYPYQKKGFWKRYRKRFDPTGFLVT